jgi:hypothetical protein
VSIRENQIEAVVDGGWLGILTGHELRVWMFLWSICDEEGIIQASHAEIGAMAGMRRNHTSTITVRLERLGLLRVIARGSPQPRRRRRANVYELLVPKPAPKERSKP